MKAFFRIWTSGMALLVGLLSVSTAAHADYKGGHLIYVQMQKAWYVKNKIVNSIAIYNSRDGGKRCFNTESIFWTDYNNHWTGDVKTSFYVANNWWFAIYAYADVNCNGPRLYERAWTPRSDSNKYWYASMNP